MKEHYARWAPHFAGEPWWDMYQALYEGPGHDWEGASEALDQMAYALAKAKGIDTTQTCPRCKAVVDECSTLVKWHNCAACRQADVERDERERQQQAAEQAAHEAWLASLPEEERNAYLEEQAQIARVCFSGLWKRDVQ